jgi:hypothetical protein
MSEVTSMRAKHDADPNSPATPPAMYRVAPWAACRELDHRDMVALSGMFRRWAIYEDDVSPDDRTKLIEHSADYERLAEWVGPHWHASDPSEHVPITKFVATLERQIDNVIVLSTITNG